jgi:hypothetical protein
MSDKWAHLGHTLGECWNDKDKSITFVHIPKNASSFVKGCLISSNCFTHSNNLITADKYLITLRDPIERWASGIAQFMSVPINQHLKLDTLINTIVLDDHTELQTYFLENVDLERCDFIKVDNNLKKNIKIWMAMNGYHVTNIDNIPNINVGNQINKFKYISILDNNSEIKLKLMNHYAKDYELINRVKFYGT